MHYTPPTVDDLLRLKAELNMSSTEMAELFGISTGRQWRKYTSKTDEPMHRRDMGLHMLFFAMAQLELDAETMDRVFDRMRQVGAQVDLSAPDGEPQP